jgi:hypothetical protein
MPKPKINTRPVAGHYAAPDELIVEFSHPNGGGLISIRATDTGVIVDVYRCDDTVTVLGSKTSAANTEGKP